MTSPKHQYLVAIGSNLGNREKYIRDACALIERRCGKMIATAKPIETEPMGVADKLFLNTAIIVESPLSPSEMMSSLLEIEEALGRIRKRTWDNRTIDLDLILALDSQKQPIVIDSDQLRIPHPNCQDRLFVLIPSAEIAGSWVHPLLKQTIEELKKDLAGK